MIVRFLNKLEAYLKSHPRAVYLFLAGFYLALILCIILFSRIAYSH